MSKKKKRRPNGSGSVRSDGYIQVAAKGHPTSGSTNLTFLHRKNLYDKIGPGKHECYYCDEEIEWFVNLECDHKDHNKSNNDPGNLVPCCFTCNRARWNREKTGCPLETEHGPYDKQYSNGHRYCSKCKCAKQKRYIARKKSSLI